MKKWSKRKNHHSASSFWCMLALFAGLCWKSGGEIYNTYMKLTNQEIPYSVKEKRKKKIWLLRSEAEGYHGCGRHDFHSGKR